MNLRKWLRLTFACIRSGGVGDNALHTLVCAHCGLGDSPKSNIAQGGQFKSASPTPLR